MAMGSGTGMEEIGNPILDAIKARRGGLPSELEKLMQASAAAVPRPGTAELTEPGGPLAQKRRVPLPGQVGFNPLGGP